MTAIQRNGVAIVLVVACGLAAAQDLRDSVRRCNDDSPDVTIPGCTAAIDSGLVSGDRLATLYSNRGIAFSDKGQHDRGIADLDRALALSPNDPVYYFNRGNIYGSMGKLDRAIADLDQAIRLKPDYARAYYNRARAYQVLGQPDRAAADMEQARRFAK